MNKETEGKLSGMRQLMQMLSGAKRYTDKNIGEVAQTTVELVEEIDLMKADKPVTAAVSIPTSGWKSGNTAGAGYPYYYDLPVSGATAADRATVTIKPDGINVATSCGMCAVNETIAGAIRLRAASIPTEAIPAEYWLEKGRSE